MSPLSRKDSLALKKKEIKVLLWSILWRKSSLSKE